MRKTLSAAGARATPDLGFTGAELDAELRAILDSGGPARIQPGDLTREAAEAYWGTARDQTYHRLNRLVAEGKLTKAIVIINGKCHTVWRPAKAGGKKDRRILSE